VGANSLLVRPGDDHLFVGGSGSGAGHSYDYVVDAYTP
jgi:hypothetical protein